MKITNQLLQKLELLFKALDYRIRYEKGNFKSGYCVLEDQNVIVVNKFFPLEGKVNALVEILRNIDPDLSTLDPVQRKLLDKLRQTELEF